MMNGWGGGAGVVGVLVMTVFWVALIAAIVWAVTGLFPARTGDAASSAASERAEDILDRRLARGEIDAPTYDELRRKLRAARVERV